MNAYELMIGDWVSYKGDGERKQRKVLEITSLRQVELWDGKNMPSWFLVGEKYIEPIPLTPEILEANGFSPRNKDKSIWRKILDDVDYRIEIHFQCNGEIEVKVAENQTNYNYIVYHGNYIHCLQHALCLAGLDQIADNLVVEKGGAQ